MKILVINTQSLNHNNATGVTLRSMFRNVPCEDLAELYMQPCVLAEDALPIRAVHLGSQECPIRTLANCLNKKSTESAPVAVQVSESHRGEVKRRIRERLIMSVDFEAVFLTRRIRKFLKEFAPDCIYTLGNSIDAMKYVCKVAKLCGISVLPHFMDNWQESHRYGNGKYPLHQKVTQKWLKKMYAYAACALTISEKMAEVYGRRWKIRHFALMNTVDVERFRCEQNRTAGEKVFVYAGGLHLNRYRSLAAIAKSVDEQNATHPEKLYHLEIYTDEKSKSLYESALSVYSSVTFRPYVTHENILSVYRRAFVLVHIESFDTENRSFIRYSLSTKISEYLATGLPILLYAPSDIFVTEYLKSHDAAAVASDENTLKLIVKRMTEDAAYRGRIGKNAQRLANEKHTIASATDILSRAIKMTCEKRKTTENGAKIH